MSMIIGRLQWSGAAFDSAAPILGLALAGRERIAAQALRFLATWADKLDLGLPEPRERVILILDRGSWDGLCLPRG